MNPEDPYVEVVGASPIALAAIQSMLQEKWLYRVKVGLLEDRSRLAQTLLGERARVLFLWDELPGVHYPATRPPPKPRPRPTVPDIRLFIGDDACQQAQELNELLGYEQGKRETCTALLGFDRPPRHPGAHVVVTPDSSGEQITAALRGIVGSLFMGGDVCFDIQNVIDHLRPGRRSLFVSSFATGPGSLHRAPHAALQALRHYPPPHRFEAVFLVLALNFPNTVTSRQLLEALAIPMETLGIDLAYSTFTNCYDVDQDHPDDTTAYLYVVREGMDSDS